MTDIVTPRAKRRLLIEISRWSSLAGAAVFGIAVAATAFMGPRAADYVAKSLENEAKFKTSVMQNFAEIKLYLQAAQARGDALRVQDVQFADRVERVLRRVEIVEGRVDRIQERR